MSNCSEMRGLRYFSKSPYPKCFELKIWGVFEGVNVSQIAHILDLGCEGLKISQIADFRGE